MRSGKGINMNRIVRLSMFWLKAKRSGATSACLSVEISRDGQRVKYRDTKHPDTIYGMEFELHEALQRYLQQAGYDPTELPIVVEHKGYQLEVSNNGDQVTVFHKAPNHEENWVINTYTMREWDAFVDGAKNNEFSLDRLIEDYENTYNKKIEIIAS